jgi:hypothetical protein
VPGCGDHSVVYKRIAPHWKCLQVIQAFFAVVAPCLISKKPLIAVKAKLCRSIDSATILLVAGVYMLPVIRSIDVGISIMRFRVAIFSALALVNFQARPKIDFRTFPI